VLQIATKPIADNAFRRFCQLFGVQTVHGLLNFQARRPNSNVAIRLLVLSLVASCYTYCIAPHHNLELNLYTSYPPVRLTAPLFASHLSPSACLGWVRNLCRPDRQPGAFQIAIAVIKRLN